MAEEYPPVEETEVVLAEEGLESQPEEVLEVEQVSSQPIAVEQKDSWVSGEGLRNRLNALNTAIKTYPDNAANYVLRGEMYLKMGEPVLAEEDFRQCAEKASKNMQQARWGFVDQAIYDRALVGLRNVEKLRK